MTMVPSIGRIVHYRLAPWDADAINRRRADGERNGRRDDGAQVHHGNRASEGDVLPAMIVRCWGDTEGAMVNLQVFLDGNDTLWVSSRQEGESVGNWFAPPRV